jgi:murein DD-endopeptidase MepM/ murein hydrolase activator NlpD
MAVSWIYIGSQAARVPGLQREVARLEEEREQVQELAMALRRLEGQYTQVRDMLGANRPNDPGSVWLPALGGPTAAEAATSDSTMMLPTAWPLVDQAFITREHLGRIPDHPGIDIAVAEGSYIRAAGPGIVREAGEDDVYGRFVRIAHADGYESVYGHASELFVIGNEEVERNQVIALTGNTGRSTAPHLHFEIWRNGEAIDPQALIEVPQ